LPERKYHQPSPFFNGNINKISQEGLNMLKRLLPFLLTLVLLAPAFTPVAAQAQIPVSLDAVEIDLWPEYDKPGVLVIFRLTLSPLTALPTDISIRIPAAVGKPFAVAGRQADGSLFNIPYTPQVSGVWTSINFTPDVSELQIEYYDPALQIEGQHRQFTFLWPGDYAVGDLSIQIQQPFDASAMLISPSFGAGIVGGDGLTYYNRDVGQLNAGQTIEIALEYDKASSTFTAQTMPVQPSGDIPEDEGGSFQVSQSTLLVIAGLVGTALIVGGVVWYLRSGQQTKASATRQRHTPAAARQSQSNQAGEGDIYCHKCGKRAQPGDRFCRSCGTELRSV
jgi:hypothetical protein